MHRSIRWTVAALMVALVPTVADATQSRINSLQNNRLIEDDTDYFVFPALASYYGRHVTLHIASGVQAAFLHGEKDGWMWGLSYNTPIVYDDLQYTENIFSLAIPTAHRILSFQAATKLGSDTMFGFAINPSFGINRSYPAAGTGIGNQYALDLEAIAGFSTRTSGMVSDSAVALSWHRFQTRFEGRTLEDTPVLPSIALRHRTLWLGQTTDWGVYGEFARRDVSYAIREPLTSEGSFSRWVLTAGVGPRFRPVEKLTIAPALEFLYQETSGSVDQDRAGVGEFVFPQVRVSAEFNPIPWLVVRAGISRNFSYRINKPITGGQTDTSTSEFDWSTGLGFVHKGFQVDATVNSGIYTNGPFLASGVGAPLFGSVSFRYTY